MTIYRQGMNNANFHFQELQELYNGASLNTKSERVFIISLIQNFLIYIYTMHFLSLNLIICKQIYFLVLYSYE